MAGTTGGAGVVVVGGDGSTAMASDAVEVEAVGVAATGGDGGVSEGPPARMPTTVPA